MTDTNNIELNPCPFCGGAPMDHAIEPHTHSPFLKSLGIPDHGGSHVVECGCGAGLIDDTKDAVFARWNQRALTARASAGEGGVAEIMRGCLTAIESGHDPRYGFPTGPSIEGIEEAAKRIAALTAAPQPAQAGASGGGELRAWVGDMKTSAGMDYYVCVGRDTGNPLDRTYLTPNKYSIRGRAEYDVAQWNHLLGHGPKPDILAFDTDATPPAHGEGEGNIAETWAKVCIALNEVDPNWMDHERDTEWDAALAAVNAIRRLATTRPTPEAQEARDAVDARRYRFIRRNASAGRISCASLIGGGLNCDEPESEWDAAIDAALALPAQGEGNRG